jgi:hypothetical protein
VRALFRSDSWSRCHLARPHCRTRLGSSYCVVTGSSRAIGPSSATSPPAGSHSLVLARMQRALELRTTARAYKLNISTRRLTSSRPSPHICLRRLLTTEPSPSGSQLYDGSARGSTRSSTAGGRVLLVLATVRCFCSTVCVSLPALPFLAVRAHLVPAQPNRVGKHKVLRFSAQATAGSNADDSQLKYSQALAGGCY